MGKDKYGLDWNVWGESGRSNNSNQSPSVLDGIGTGWSPRQQAQQEDTDEEATTQQNSTTARLKNAQFQPDNTTDFNKPCKVRVEIESSEPFTSPVTFNLWSSYNEQRTDLHYEAKAEPKDNVAETELKLYYDDAYYQDAIIDEKPDITVDYIFKVNARGAQEIESAPLTMPHTPSRKIKILLEDDSKMAIKGVTITLDTGETFTTDDNGMIEFDLPEDVESVCVNEIVLPE